MAPPMMNSSAFSIMERMTWILSPTLAPPMMARNGRSGLASLSSRNSSSLAMRNPMALCETWWVTPSVDA